MQRPPASPAGARRALSVLAWAQWLFFVACFGTALWLAFQARALSLDALALGSVYLSFATAGAVIASQRPSNPVGWLFAAIGLGTGITILEAGYTRYALFFHQDLAAPGLLALVWLANCVWPLNVGCGSFILLLFPDGHLPSRRWRPVAWLDAMAIAGEVITTAFAPGRFSGEVFTNPLGIPQAGVFLSAVSNVSNSLFVLATILAVASVFVRFMRSRGEQRQQLKWFTYGAAMGALIIAVSILVFPESASNVPFAIAFAMLPAGAGIAILRYRLYDIDLIINRTLVYGSLTAILGAVYFGAVLAAQEIGQALTGVKRPPAVVIVATTLLIAALFNPLRHRLQTTIDRRFYRRKYDVARTLAAFGMTLRTETDLAELRQHLVAVVQETMQPASISLWLRVPARHAPSRQTDEAPPFVS